MEGFRKEGKNHGREKDEIIGFILAFIQGGFLKKGLP